MQELKMDDNEPKNKRNANGNLRSNLLGALLAGLAVGYELWMQSVSSYRPQYRLRDYAVNAGLAITCYIAATFLVWRVYWKGLIVRLPHWAIASLTGSTLIVVYALVVHYITMATHPEAWAFELKQPIREMLLKEAMSSLGFSLLFTVLYSTIALPIMAIIHYGARMLSLSRKYI